MLRNGLVQVCNLQVTCATCILSVHPYSTEGRKGYIGMYRYVNCR